jgi:hypothetical protein
MALAIKSIADLISGITITGVTINTLATLNKWEFTGPTLFPDPVDFVTNVTFTRDSFGTNATAKAHLEYTLHYTFAYAWVGSGYNLWSIYDGMTTLFGQILDALLALDVAGAVDLQLAEVFNFGQVIIPNDTAWHGCKIALRVLEFLN